MSEFVNTIDTVGDEALTNSIIVRSITTLEDDKVLNIGYYAFIGCSNLTTVNFLNVTTIGYQAFNDCSNLTTVNFPNVTTIDMGAFNGCSNLTTVNFLNVTTISYAAFKSCSNLTTVNFPNVTTIAAEAFWFSGLTTLILRNTEKVCKVAYDSFRNTPIASGEGYIYVPRDLVDSYKAATNWSTYADQIRALEDYTVDGTVTGELDNSKI